MAFGKKSSNSCSPVCILIKWVVCILLLLVAVAAAIGVYQTHILTAAEGLRLQFGSTSGSLSIIAFSIATVAFIKKLMWCMSDCEICSK